MPGQVRDEDGVRANVKMPPGERLNTGQAAAYLREHYGIEVHQTTVMRAIARGDIAGQRVHPQKRNSWWYTTRTALDEYAARAGIERIRG